MVLCFIDGIFQVVNEWNVLKMSSPPWKCVTLGTLCTQYGSVFLYFIFFQPLYIQIHKPWQDCNSRKWDRGRGPCFVKDKYLFPVVCPHVCIQILLIRKAFPACWAGVRFFSRVRRCVCSQGGLVCKMVAANWATIRFLPRVRSHVSAHVVFDRKPFATNWARERIF